MVFIAYKYNFNIIALNLSPPVNSFLPYLLIGCFGGLGLCSCSLFRPSSSVSALPPGKQFEVRRALGKSESFRPSALQSRYFVLRPDSANTPCSPGSNLMVRTTAYCHSEADHVPYGSLSAMGTPLRHGMIRSAAADWSRFPLGTRFRIKSQPGVVYEIDDYGSALVGTNTIDIYCTTEKSMDAWGVRHCDIEVLNWGSYANSLALMKDRVAFPHVRHMVHSIRQKLGLETPSLTTQTQTTAASGLLVAAND